MRVRIGARSERSDWTLVSPSPSSTRRGTSGQDSARDHDPHQADDGPDEPRQAPSGAQNPPLSHVVPPSTPRTTTATPAPNSRFEISLARQSPNDPDMISIARGNELNTTRAHTKSFSPAVSV